MQAALLEWLEVSGSLSSLARQCAEHAETGKVRGGQRRRNGALSGACVAAFPQAQAVYKLLLHVDPLLLTQHNGEPRCPDSETPRALPPPPSPQLRWETCCCTTRDSSGHSYSSSATRQ